MNRALFVSDIHIASPEDPKYSLFLRFLEKCLDCPPAQLFLVGDIFDLWISDRRFFVERYSEAIEKLLLLTGKGVQIHYFEGNHDLDLKIYWQQVMGFDVLEDAAYFDIGGMKFRVEHGDLMDPSDKSYLFLRWLLRTPVLRFLCRHLPDVMVHWIGSRASQVSRRYTGNPNSLNIGEIKDKIHRYARLAYKSERFDVLVSGHVHVCDDVNLNYDGKNFRSINLGTWLNEPLVLIVGDASQNPELVPLTQFLA